MSDRPRQDSVPPAGAPEERLADALHSAAIHILRRVRVHDTESGLTPSRLSALSVVVFGGPLSLTSLAAAEQVSLPTISRLVGELEREGLVEKLPDPEDRRVRRVVATAAGESLMWEGRRRRVAALARRLADLEPEELAVLRRAAPVLRSLALPAAHPEAAEGRGPGEARPEA
jgi:DNA-binding MarR family transcriptional regulator